MSMLGYIFSVIHDFLFQMIYLWIFYVFDFRYTTDTRRTETIKLTTLHGTKDKQSQRLSAYVPSRNNNGSSFTSSASNQTTSFVFTKIEKQHIESNMISVKKSKPVLRCNCSSPKQKSQSANIPKIELNKENSEVESKSSSPITADESYHDLKEGIDKKETNKSPEMRVTDASNNILHIDMYDSVHKRDRTIQTTPVIWLWNKFEFYLQVAVNSFAEKINVNLCLL